MLVCRPSRTISRPSTSTCRTSAAPAANTTESSACSGSVPASRTPVERDRHEVGARAGLDPPGVRPAEAGVPVLGGGPQQGRGAVVPALAAREALVELHRARLLEQVDHGVRVAAERQRGARVDQRGASGRCRRRGRARSSGRRSSTRPRRRAGVTSASSRCVACTAVKFAVERAGVGEQAPSACARRPRGRPRSRPAARTRARAAAAPARAPSRPRSPRPRGRPRACCGSRRRSAPTRSRRASSTRSAQASALPSEKRRCASSGGSPIPPCR